MGRRALVGFLVVFAVFGLWRAAPWAAQERERIAGSPSLGGFYSANPVVVPRGEAACVAPVPLSPDVAKVSVSVIAKTPQPLELTLRGPGYSADADLPADYPTGGETPVTFLLDERPPGELMGELCVANAGEREVSFAGTEEPRSVVVAGTTVAGKPRPDMAVTLYGGSRSGSVGFASSLVDRGAALTGGLLPGFLVWLLLVAFVIGVPAGAIVALMRSFDR